ncbi:hypothetical protein D3C85_1791920 [compost metagenome]
MLTTGTGGAIHVDTQICRVDFDINIVIHFRVNKGGAEGRVAATAGVEWAFTDQAMHARFGA